MAQAQKQPKSVLSPDEAAKLFGSEPPKILDQEKAKELFGSDAVEPLGQDQAKALFSEDKKEPSKLDYFVENLPAYGATAGGLLGGASGGAGGALAFGLGAVPGAAAGSAAGAGIGGAAGTALKNAIRKLRGEDVTREEIYVEPLEEGAKSAAYDMAGGAIGRGVGRAVGSVKKVAGDLSEKAAFKQAGGMLKEFRLAMGRNKLSEIGKDILETKVKVPTEGGALKSETLYKFGDKVDDIARKSNLVKKEVGEEIGSIYKAIDNKLAKDPQSLSSLKSRPFNPQEDAAELLSTIEKKYGNKIDGQKVISRAADIVDQIRTRPATMQEALAIKNELDDLINYSKLQQDLPAAQNALIDMRNFIRDRTNKFVEESAESLGVTNGKNIKDLNRKFGNLSTISEMASDKAARESANRAISLTDYIAGGAGFAAAGPGGLLAIGANKLARERGPGMAAVGAKALKGVLPDEEVARLLGERLGKPGAQLMRLKNNE